MSDETPPSPLRLKPRQRAESEEAAGTPATPDEGKLRLKPKLGDTFDDAKPAEPEEPPETEPSPPAVEPVRAKPKLNLEPEPEPQPEPEPAAVEPAPEEPPVIEAEEAPPPPPPMPEEGKIKLKIKLPGAAAQETTIPPKLEPEEAEPSLPPFPVVAPPPPEEGDEGNAPPLLATAKAPRTPTPFPGTLPPGGSRPAVFKRPRVPAALLAAERRKRMWKYAGIAVVGVVLAGGVIFGAYLKFTEPPPPTRVPPKPIPAVKAPEPVVVAPVPSKAPTPPVETPVEHESTTRVNSAVNFELAPGVTATSEAVKAVPNASSAFKQFVASAKISGVYQGTPPRAFINGRLVHTGEMIDDALEIYFDSVDLPARSIVFKDSRGATVSRRY